MGSGSHEFVLRAKIPKRLRPTCSSTTDVVSALTPVRCQRLQRIRHFIWKVPSQGPPDGRMREDSRERERESYLYSALFLAARGTVIFRNCREATVVWNSHRYQPKAPHSGVTAGRPFIGRRRECSRDPLLASRSPYRPRSSRDTDCSDVSCGIRTAS